MDVLEAITNRRSIRSYKREPISDESLDTVLLAAQKAPSAANRQELKFVVVTSEAVRKDLAVACNNQSFLADAGAIIVACATDPQRRYHAVDAAIAVDHMTLAAHSLGLGSCWIGAFDEAKVKAILGIPDQVKVICVLPVGIPAAPGVPRSRKTKEELFSKDAW